MKAFGTGNKSTSLRLTRLRERKTYWLISSLALSVGLTMVGCGKKSTTTFGGGTRGSGQGKLTCEQQLLRGQEKMVANKASVCEEHVSPRGNALVPVAVDHPSYFKFKQASASAVPEIAMKVLVDFPASTTDVDVARGMVVLTGRCAPAIKDVFSRSKVKFSLEFQDVKSWNGRMPTVAALPKGKFASAIQTSGHAVGQQQAQGSGVIDSVDAQIDDVAGRTRTTTTKEDPDAAKKMPRLVFLESAMPGETERFELAFWPRAAPLFLSESKRCEQACDSFKVSAAKTKCLDSCSAVLNDPFCEDVAKWTGLMLGFKDQASMCVDSSASDVPVSGASPAVSPAKAVTAARLKLEDQGISGTNSEAPPKGNILRGHRELAPGVKVIDENGHIAETQGDGDASAPAEGATEKSKQELIKKISEFQDKTGFLYTDAGLTVEQKSGLLPSACADGKTVSARSALPAKLANKDRAQFKVQQGNTKGNGQGSTGSARAPRR